MDPPWSMSIKDEAPLTLICQTHGRAAIVGESSGTFWLGPGDVALTRGTEHYIFADDPATTPMVVIHPGQRCTTLSGEDLRFEMSLGVRTWGNSAVRRDALGDLCLRGPQRGQHPAARCAAHRAGAPRRRMGHAAGESARRRGGPRRSRPGGVSRPAARPAADRRTAHLVRPRRERPDLVARRTRPGGRPGAEADLQQSRRIPGRSRISLRPWGVRVPCSPAGSPNRSANHRSRS